MSPRRFRGRSLAELRERAAQAATAFLERSGLVASREFSSAGLAAHIAGANGHDPFLVHGPVFPSLLDRAATVDAIRRLAPDAEGSLRQRADAALEGHFELLGFRDVSCGNPPDWRLDPIRGVRAPDAHWSLIRYLDPAVVGDHKLVWELSRHRHVLELAQAGWLTGESRYADACARALDSWMDSNPPKRGIHWASSLEVALRAIAWLWVLALLGPRLSGQLRQQMLGFLIVSGRHIERYLSTYFSPNTHLTGEALGLYYLGTMLPQVRQAARWQDRGAAILNAWVERHVRPDGVYVEQSTWYHRYTTDIYLHYLLLARLAGASVPAAIPARLEGMMAHLMFVARPDGRIPLIGDDDGGRLLFLDDRTAHDVRTPLAVAAIIFGRSDFAHVARSPGAELVWLLGPEGAAQWAALSREVPTEASRAFRDGGIYVMRDHWGADGSVAVVDAGPHGFLNAGHAHADALAIDLTVRGTPVFVDPGTFTYTLSREDRDYFRSGAAHNAVTVDGHGSAVPSGPFRWASTTRGQCHAWHAFDRAVLFRGSHDGFERLAPPVRYTRTVLFLPPELWLVHDEIVGAGEHELTVHWQCAPGIEVAKQGDGSLTIMQSGTEVLHLSAGEAEAQVTAGWVSPAYGVRERAPHIALVRRGSERVSVLTVLHANGQTGPGADVGVALDQRVVAVRAGARRGLFVHGGAATGRLATDASVAWLELGPGDAPTWVIAADVQTLGVDGEPLLVGERRRAVIALERRGSAWTDVSHPGQRDDPGAVVAVRAGTHGGGT